MNRIQSLVMLLVILTIAACSAPAESPTQSSGAPATAVEQTAHVQDATAASLGDAPAADTTVPEPASEEVAAQAPPQEEEPAPAAEAAVEPVDWLTVTGRTEEGLATLGNPDAAITMIDYSDFM
ncbi:MAG: hypothetical protein R2911_24025 [Caldilineaceae bacterium]